MLDLQRDLAPSVRPNRLKKWTTHHIIALPWEYDGIRFYLTDQVQDLTKEKKRKEKVLESNLELKDSSQV